MNEVLVLFERWQLDMSSVREQVYRASTPRERERWHAVWLLAQGWSQVQVAAALERDAHTVGEWLAGFRQSGPTSLAFEQTGGAPRPRRGAAG
jgi:transposase